MAELTIRKNEELSGIKKEVDEGAFEIVFQAIQEDIYSYPIRSFVRETISNGIDSHTERDIALDIITNGAPISKYYREEQDGLLLKDSVFNAEYYNPKYLSRDSTVTATYHERPGYPRDYFEIADNGVGLHGDRLRGYFKIGYSTKRNLQAAIGKYGSGSKSGLATGVDYFVITSTYNGYKTSFMVFKQDYEPITQQNENGYTDTWKVTMANGEERNIPIHWEPTTETNGVTVGVEVKKHNKEKFLTAVKTQFQYFDNVVLNTVKAEERPQNIELSRGLLYQSDAVFLPKESMYSVPHILVGGISYGPISWEELELENRKGQVALRVDANDVDITQSREALKWTEKTRKTVLGVIDTCKKEASEYMQTALPDLTAADTLLGKLKASKNTAALRENKTIQAFSRFLCMSLINPTIEFKVKNQLVKNQVNEELFDFIFYYFSVHSVKFKGSRSGINISKTEVKNFDFLTSKSPTYFAVNATLGPKRACALIEESETDEIIYIRRNNKVAQDIFLQDQEFAQEDMVELAHTLIGDHATGVLDDMVFEKEEELADSQRAAGLSRARERKLNKEAVVLYKNNTRGSRYSKKVCKVAEFSSLPDLVDPTGVLDVYYATGSTTCTQLVDIACSRWETRAIAVVKVAQDFVGEIIKLFPHISEFYRGYDKSTDTISIPSWVQNRLTRNYNGCKLLPLEALSQRCLRYFPSAPEVLKRNLFAVNDSELSKEDLFSGRIVEPPSESSREAATALTDYYRKISEWNVLMQDPEVTKEELEAFKLENFGSSTVTMEPFFDPKDAEEGVDFLTKYLPVSALIQSLPAYVVNEKELELIVNEYLTLKQQQDDRI